MKCARWRNKTDEWMSKKSITSEGISQFFISTRNVSNVCAREWIFCSTSRVLCGARKSVWVCVFVERGKSLIFISISKRVTFKNLCLWPWLFASAKNQICLCNTALTTFSCLRFSGVMQATTGEAWEKRYSPSFRDADPLRRQSSTKRKRDEVLRLVHRHLVLRHWIIII